MKRTGGTRAWREVPAAARLALLGCLLAAVAWQAAQPPPRARLEALPAAPSAAVLRVLAGGDARLTARLVMLWLTSFDVQPGLSLPYAALDYARLRDWLALALDLDPTAQYPLLAASRLYGEVADPARSRSMLDFVAARFAQDPARRWPWLAHAVFVAQHRLKDAALARAYARQLAAAPASAAIPGWARQLEIFVLEDFGELEAAQILLGGLLDSGRITDAHERAFLARRLADIAARRGAVEKRSESSE
ncbi:MAG TPA: hypothetical protein PJ986_01130 [Gammaproteobacteria bacterium]|nr:hypothetical protein [Gammaproteobacteria bacterium]